MKTFTFISDEGPIECWLEVNEYVNNGHIALSMYSEDGPYADITVNIEGMEVYPGKFSYVDTNNFPDAESLISQLGIGKKTGYYAHSGFCQYPLYEFDVKRLQDFK